MKTAKNLGVWMDHSKAHLIDLTNDSMVTYTVEPNTILKDESQDFGNDESRTHNKEQNQLSDFFKKLSDYIIDFDDVILFGPTNAKTELLNLLKKNHHFDKIRIIAKSADNMTNNQLQAFVENSFNMPALLP
jgi:hypothetical protein